VYYAARGAGGGSHRFRAGTAEKARSSGHFCVYAGIFRAIFRAMAAITA
jgi:hypothetical protein